jgi:putative addiction module component (TIGR02574 family)
MNAELKDKVNKLSKKEKIQLYYSLQEELDWDDDYLAEDDLTPKQWKELDKRIADIDSGKAKLIPWKDFKKEMDESIKKIRSGVGRKSNA